MTFNIEKKIFVGISIIISIIFIIFIILVIAKINSIIDLKEYQQYDLLRKSINAHINEQYDIAKISAISLSENTQIKIAFKERDRDKILFLLSNTFESLNFYVSQIHFHLPDSTSFLRLHMLDKFGDDLSDHRFTVNDANKSKSIITGLEEGSGGLGFRAVVPISYNNEHLGTVEYGIVLDNSFLEDLKIYFGGEYELHFFDNKYKYVENEELIQTSKDRKYSLIYVPLINYSGENIGYILSKQSRHEILSLFFLQDN